MIGYPNLTYLLIGQNFVNIMITELSERRIDLHPVLKAKIHSLRSMHQREQKKVRDSTRSGMGADAIYTPKLWYYGMMHFLNNSSQARASVSNIEYVT